MRKIICWLRNHVWEEFNHSEVALMLHLRACARCGRVEETARYTGQYPLPKGD